MRIHLSLAVAALSAVLVSCGGQQSSTPKDTTEAAAPAPAAPAPAAESPAMEPKPAEVAQATPPVTETQPAEPPPVRHEPAPPKKKVESKPAGRTETEMGGGTAEMNPPAPAPPKPEPIVKSVPAGTALDVVFLDPVSSATSQVGDSFRAKVARDVMVDGIAVIPAGSVVIGSVTEAVSLKKIGGQAKLTLDFSRVELPSGRTAPVHASLAQLGKSETKKDAATIGGAAAGGAILGRVLSKHDKGKGTVLGAIAGAAAGTAIASKTAGQEIEIPAGTQSSLQLDQPTEVTVDRS